MSIQSTIRAENDISLRWMRVGRICFSCMKAPVTSYYRHIDCSAAKGKTNTATEVCRLSVSVWFGPQASCWDLVPWTLAPPEHPSNQSWKRPMLQHSPSNTILVEYPTVSQPNFGSRRPEKFHSAGRTNTPRESFSNSPFNRISTLVSEEKSVVSLTRWHSHSNETCMVSREHWYLKPTFWAVDASRASLIPAMPFAQRTMSKYSE